MKYKNPRIKSIYPLYKLDDSTFRIGAQQGLTREFKDTTHQLWTLANLLNGQSIDKVLEKEKNAFPEEHLTDQYILDGIDLLNKENFIEEAEPEKIGTINDRYVPNVKYFSSFVNASGDRFRPQEIISDSTILLLGLGGGGSNVLTLLAGLGPKKIKIVDYDVVEEENLGRQFLYKESDIGKKKTEVAKKAINEINSNIDIEVHNLKIKKADDITQYLDDVDLVISVIDEPQFVITRIVNEAIVKANKPCVFAGTQVTHGRVFTIIPNVTGCFDCLNIHYTLIDPQFIDQFVGLGKSHHKVKSIAYGPAVFQLTATVVDEAVRILTKYKQPSSLSTQFEVDYENISSYKHPAWPRYEDKCPTCGNGKEADWEVFKYFPLYAK